MLQRRSEWQGLECSSKTVLGPFGWIFSHQPGWTNHLELQDFSVSVLTNTDMDIFWILAVLQRAGRLYSCQVSKLLIACQGAIFPSRLPAGCLLMTGRHWSSVHVVCLKSHHWELVSVTYFLHRTAPNSKLHFIQFGCEAKKSVTLTRPFVLAVLKYEVPNKHQTHGHNSRNVQISVC